MNKAASANRLLIKTICLALALTFGASLTAAGVMADSGCGMKCCCLSQPMTRHHSPQEHIRSSGGCCNQTPLLPCDLASGNRLELHGINLAYTNCSLTHAASAAAILSDEFIDLYGFRVLKFDPLTREKFRSPPLYLQNLSFLI